MKIESGKYYVWPDSIVREVCNTDGLFSAAEGETVFYECRNEQLKPLSNCKIKIEDEEHYNQVIGMLYKSGCKWNSGRQLTYGNYMEWISLDEKLHMTWSNIEYCPQIRQIYFPKQTRTEQKGENMEKREMNYEALAGKVIPYNTKEDWEAIYTALMGIGCEMHSTCEKEYADWRGFVLSDNGEYMVLGNTLLYNIISLQEAIKLLLKPKKSKDQLEQEKKIAELKETIEKVQKQIQELQNNQ